MIKVENVDLWGFEHAIRGMRNPMNSWNKSDTTFELVLRHDKERAHIETKIGNNDLDLMQRLYKAGTEHRKYLRQIFVSMDITAPLYWWKEFDTYKVGTVANSCSTMHTIHRRAFSLDDFSVEHVVNEEIDVDYNNGLFFHGNPENCFVNLINVLNACRDKYLETKDKKWWWQLIQLLPSSYNQKRTVTMNYENVMTIIKQRTGHRLDEWRDFIEVLYELPYVKEITKDE